MEEKTEQWRKLRNEELHNFFSLPDNIRVRISKSMSNARHMKSLWRLEMHIKF
jgi:hypothetical protein